MSPIALSVTRATQLDDIIPHDWAIAGFDMFSNGHGRHHDFPKYRLLSQTACLDLARQSDVLTLVPERSAVYLTRQMEWPFFINCGFARCCAKRSARQSHLFMVTGICTAVANIRDKWARATQVNGCRQDQVDMERLHQSAQQFLPIDRGVYGFPGFHHPTFLG